MKSVYQIVKELEATSSRLDKEAILAANKGNEDLKAFFRYALEPKINFYIKKLPAYTLNASNPLPLDMAMAHVYVELACRQVTGNAARQKLSEIFSQMTMEDALMLERVINKDPKCGCSTSTVNKIWSDLVTDVPYMRCSLPKDIDMEAIDWEEGVYSQLKADGMFANLSHHIDSDIISLESRNGSPFPISDATFDGIREAVRRANIRGKQLHGELLVEKNGVILERQISNGLMNSVLNGEPLPEDHKVLYFAWDIIPLSEAKAKNKYRVPYKVRFEEVSQVCNGLGQSWPIQLIETRIVYSYEEAYAHFKEKRKLKQEGTIIKFRDMIWEDTTSKGQIKMKSEVEVDLRIIGFKDANKTSKNADTFGSVLLASSDDLLEVAATGITDDMRKLMHEIRDQLIEKIMTVRSNELMKPSKNNPKYSLFLPRFVEIRQDKTEADSLEKIIKQFESAIED